MRLMDLLLAFPQFILAMAITAALGGSLVNVIVAIALTNIPIYAYLMRVKILSLKGSQFAMAARAAGNPRVRVLYRHLLPNSWGPIFVQATLQPGWAILPGSLHRDRCHGLQLGGGRVAGHPRPPTPMRRA
jgi:peptide/nickel transport system permease protein